MHVAFVVNRILIRWPSIVLLVLETAMMNIKLDAEISSYPQSATIHLLVRFCLLPFMFCLHYW